MIQDKIKSQIEQLKEQGEKLQSQVNKQFEGARTEGLRILAELGADVKGEKIELSKVAQELREANPTLKQFVRNLDVATYDNRFRLNWNAKMSAAYAKLQANKTFSKEVEPRISEAREAIKVNFNEARDTVETRLRALQDKARELRGKIAS